MWVLENITCIIFIKSIEPEKLKEIYFRRTKKHIRDFSKIRIEYIEVEEKVY